MFSLVSLHLSELQDCRILATALGTVELGLASGLAPRAKVVFPECPGLCPTIGTGKACRTRWGNSLPKTLLWLHKSTSAFTTFSHTARRIHCIMQCHMPLPNLTICFRGKTCSRFQLKSDLWLYPTVSVLILKTASTSILCSKLEVVDLVESRPLTYFSTCRSLAHGVSSSCLLERVFSTLELAGPGTVILRLGGRLAQVQRQLHSQRAVEAQSFSRWPLYQDSAI